VTFFPVIFFPTTAMVMASTEKLNEKKKTKTLTKQQQKPKYLLLK